MEPKLADFGFATRNESKMESSALYKLWRKRNSRNLAPEVLKFKKYFRENNVFDEKKADIFAFGVTLFTTVFYIDPLPVPDKYMKEDYQKIVF